jgi:hypothetical protein
MVLVKAMAVTSKLRLLDSVGMRPLSVSKKGKTFWVVLFTYFKYETEGEHFFNERGKG